MFIAAGLFLFHTGLFWDAIRPALVLFALGTGIWFSIRSWEYARHRGKEVDAFLKVRRGILFGAYDTSSEALAALQDEMRTLIRSSTPLEISEEVVDAILGLPLSDEGD